MANASPSTPSLRQTQRLQVQFEASQNDPLPFVRNLQLGVADGVNEVTGVLLGTENSDYAGGHFRFSIRFPPQYPFKPPDMYFLTAICHPNIDSKTGTVCHDSLLNVWDPKFTLNQILTEMHSLLATPHYDIPVKGDPLTSKNPENARQWTKTFAGPSE